MCPLCPDLDCDGQVPAPLDTRFIEDRKALKLMAKKPKGLGPTPPRQGDTSPPAAFMDAIIESLDAVHYGRACDGTSIMVPRPLDDRWQDPAPWVPEGQTQNVAAKVQSFPGKAQHGAAKKARKHAGDGDEPPMKKAKATPVNPHKGAANGGSILGRAGLPTLDALKEVLAKQHLGGLQIVQADNILELDGLRNRMHAGLLKQEIAAKLFPDKSRRAMCGEITYNEDMDPVLPSRACRLRDFDYIKLAGAISEHAGAQVRVARWLGRCESVLDAAGSKF